MGLLRLLAFPVLGPLDGGRWVANTLLREAERKYYDQGAILEALADLERRFSAGEVDEATFEAEEETLLARLLEARDYHRRQQEQGQES